MNGQKSVNKICHYFYINNDWLKSLTNGYLYFYIVIGWLDTIVSY